MAEELESNGKDIGSKHFKSGGTYCKHCQITYSFEESYNLLKAQRIKEGKQQIRLRCPKQGCGRLLRVKPKSSKAKSTFWAKIKAVEAKQPQFEEKTESESVAWIKATESFHIIDLMQANDSIIPEPNTKHKQKKYLLQSALHDSIVGLNQSQRDYLYIISLFSDTETDYLLEFCDLNQIPNKNVLPIDWDIEKLNYLKHSGVENAIRANIYRDLNVIFAKVLNLIGKNYILYTNSYGSLLDDLPIHKHVAKLKGKHKPLQHTFVLSVRPKIEPKIEKLRKIYPKNASFDAKPLGSVALVTVKW